MNYASLSLALLCSNSLFAQIPEPRIGPFSTTGLVFARPGAGSELRRFRADRQDVVELDAMGASGVLYRTERIFASVLSAHPTLAGLIEIDGFSTGNDLVPISPVTPATVPPVFLIDPARAGPGWSALFLSFRLDSVSVSGPMPMAERRVEGWAGGDLYSWIAPGSEPLGEFEDEIFLDVRAGSLGLEPNGEITVLDIPLALLAQNGGVTDPLFAPHLDCVYFSLTKASAATVAAVYGFGSNFPAECMSGATVFQSQWSGGAWGAITVAKTPSELGLDNNTPFVPDDDEELDALAVEGIHPATAVVVYSIAAPSSFPQLMAASGTAHGELRTQSQDPITSRIGDSDIDALCGIDPEGGYLSRRVGTPIAPTLPSLSLILSATQMFTPPLGQYVLVMHVNGPPAGSDEVLPAIPMCVEASSGGSSDADWLPLVVTSWSGTGSFPIVVPITFTLNMPVYLRAVLLPPGQPPAVSTMIGTIL